MQCSGGGLGQRVPVLRCWRRTSSEEARLPDNRETVTSAPARQLRCRSSARWLTSSAGEHDAPND